MHYCKDRLVNLGLNKTDSKECDECGMKKEANNGCCKDEHKQVKLQSDQKAAESFLFSFHDTSDVVIVPFTEYHSSFSVINSYLLPYSNGPPEPRGTNLYLVNRVFRI